MTKFAIDSAVINEDGRKINDFLKRKGYEKLSSYTVLPGMEGIRIDKETACACYLYEIPDLNRDTIKDLIKELQAEKPYAEPQIFISSYGVWKMVKEDETKEPSVVQHITAGTVGQIAGHDITISSQYLEPKNYLNILEQAIQNDPKFSAASDEDKASFLSKFKALKNDPWVSGIGTTVLIEIGKKMFGL